MSPTAAASSQAHVLPPGPGSPAWWQLLRFAGDPLRLLDACHRRYGDAFTLNVAGNSQFVMLSDPEAVREVFRGDPDVLHSGEANALFTANRRAALGAGARFGRSRRNSFTCGRRTGRAVDVQIGETGTCAAPGPSGFKRALQARATGRNTENCVP